MALQEYYKRNAENIAGLRAAIECVTRVSDKCRLFALESDSERTKTRIDLSILVILESLKLELNHAEQCAEQIGLKG